MRKLDFLLHLLLFAALLILLIINPKEGILYVLVAQLFVGIYQVISSVIRSIRFHAFDPTIQRLLGIYWLLCLAYVIMMIGFQCFGNERAYFHNWFFSAWGIAVYYCYITYLLAFPKYIKSHLDI